jgi:hypothetical protein
MKRRVVGKRISLVVMIGVLAVSLAPARAAVAASKDSPDGAQFAVDSGTLRIQFWSQDIARVTYAAAAEPPTIKSLSVVASQPAVPLTQKENEQAFTLVAPRPQVRIDQQTGAVSFLDPADCSLFRESARGRKIEPATQSKATSASLARSFDLSPDESHEGFKQRGQGDVFSGNTYPNLARIAS